MHRLMLRMGDEAANVVMERQLARPTAQRIHGFYAMTYIASKSKNGKASGTEDKKTEPKEIGYQGPIRTL